MRVIFNCHTEYDLINKFGWAKQTEADQQTFDHLPRLLDWLDQFDIPVTFSVGLGGPLKNNLLKYIQAKKIKFPSNSEIAIHFHSEKFERGSWRTRGFLAQSAYADYCQKFKEVFDFRPRSMVFGKWRIDRSAMNFLGQLGIRKDGSFVSPQKIIARPFLVDNILEVPVVSFNGQPVNPLTRLSHFFLLKKIIKSHYQDNLILHIGFHSYDFFNFGRGSKMRLIKKIIFKNLLKNIQRYNLEIVTLSKIEKDNFKELNNMQTPFWGGIFDLINH